MQLLHTHLIDSSRPIIIGVSGGADSMALLHALDSAGYKLVIAHCNFHLRGEESDRDEDFVRRQVQGDYPRHTLEVAHFDTHSYAEEQHISIEMAARELRYEWFGQLMQKYSTTTLAIAHHADDQIETLLLNLSRGTGGQGLVGMEPYRDGLWRPLLTTSRTQILEYLNEHGLAHVEDSSNEETVYRRNLIRRELIPLFEQLNPSFRTSALRSMHLFAEEQHLIQSTVDDWVARQYDEKTHSFALSGQIHEPLILYRWLTPMGFSADQVTQMISGWERSGAIFTSATGKVIERFRRKGYFVQDPSDIRPQIIEGGATKSYLYGDIGTVTIDGKVGQLRISPTIMDKKLVLRPADKADRMQVFGQKQGSRQLFDVLKDMGIPSSYRPHVPVLAVAHKVYAIPPLQISEEARVGASEAPILIQFTPSPSPIGHLLIKNSHFSVQKALGRR